MVVSKVKILLKFIIFLTILCLILNLFSSMVSPSKIYTRLTLNEMYTQSEPINMVFVGASRVYRGFAPKVFDDAFNINSFNLGSSSQSTIDSYYLLCELYRHHTPETVIIDITFHRFKELSDKKSAEILYDYFKPSLNKLNYLIHRFDPQDYLSTVFPIFRNTELLFSRYVLENIKTKVSHEYLNFDYISYDHEYYGGKGFVYSLTETKTGEVGYIEPSYLEWELNPQIYEYYIKMIEMCQGKGSNVILVAPPVPYATISQLQSYDVYKEFASALVIDYGVKFFDYNMIKCETWCRKDDYFYDWMHLNGKGALQFSQSLADLIKKSEVPDFQIEEYFYSSHDDFIKNNNFIYNTWMGKDVFGIQAYSNHGSSVTPEYQFSYRHTNNDNGKYKIIQAYSVKSSLDFDMLSEGEYEIMVETRAKGKNDMQKQSALIEYEK